MIALWLALAHADPPRDVAWGALVPDRAGVRLQGALAPGAAVLGFGDVHGALPVWSSPRGTVTVGLTGQVGWVASAVPSEARGGVRVRAAGGGLWFVFADPTLRQRHALGLVATAGHARWFRWHPDEVDAAGMVAWESHIPVSARIAVRGSLWVGVNRVQGLPAHVRGDLGVVAELHPRWAVHTGVVGGGPPHLQAVVGVLARAAPGVLVDLDVQLPVRAPHAWTAPTPTVGLGLTLRDPSRRVQPGPPWSVSPRPRSD